MNFFVVSDMQWKNKNYGARRYRTKKFPFLLPQVQTGNNYPGAANEYIRYQRARHTDAEPITVFSLVKIALGKLYQYLRL